jgi:signal transduction histidine kinase
MQGFATTLSDEYGSHLDEKANKYIERVVEGARYMDMLLRDILEYSRLTQSQLELSPVMLEPLIDSLLEQSKESLNDKKARIDVIRPLLPVVGHLPTLRQSLSNLIDNALKFVPPERTPHIRIWTEKRTDMVRIWIQDNGIGIAGEYQEKIFKLFERLHTGEVYPGTGVGLAIVRKAAERMRGHVGLESTVNEGSRFWLELPAVR